MVVDSFEKNMIDNDTVFEDEPEESGQSHLDYVNLVRSDMYDVESVYDLAELFKIFGDSTRLRIMSALLDHELCVCDISEVLEMNQSAISHQLRVLRTAGLIKARRCGKSAFDGEVTSTEFPSDRNE